jgi:hypothetical protein
VTIAKRPLWVQDAREDRCDLPNGARENVHVTGNLRMAGMQTVMAMTALQRG